MRTHKKQKVTLKAVWMLAVMVCCVLLSGSTVSVKAAGRPVQIASCLAAGSDVICTIRAERIPSSDDGIFYVYANEVYEDGPTGRLAAEVSAGEEVSVSFPLNYQEEDSNLSCKFLVAMKQGGEMVQVSDEHYITNPESQAGHTAFRANAGIKGILPDFSRISKGELEELGISQVVYNMYLDDICSSPEAADAILFMYNGRTWYFDKTVIENYDTMTRFFAEEGIQMTMVLLNGGRGAYSQDLVHPLAVGGDCPGYALNVTDKGGVEHLKAISAFLAMRYSGYYDCGQIDNWVIGNEVNARTSWWYMNSASLEENVSAYVKAFRIIYNEMKAVNANLRIYNSIDQEWNRKSNPGSFLAKDYLDRFNYYMNREGNIDWGLSFHPYNSPLYDPYAWNGSAVWVKDNLKTPYITMQNLDILIDYMHQPEFLNPAGDVRSISLAEIGYTSSFGSKAQEASIAYGYLKAASFPEIDAFMLFRHTDDAHEMESHLALGLCDLTGNKKPAYDIYRDLGTEREAQAKARASEIIGMDIDEMIANHIMWTRSGDGVVK